MMNRFLKFFFSLVILISSMVSNADSYDVTGSHQSSNNWQSAFVSCKPNKSMDFDKEMLDADRQTINDTTRLPLEFENLYSDKVLLRGIVKDKNCVPVSNALIEIRGLDEYGVNANAQFSYSFSERYGLNNYEYSKTTGLAVAETDNRGFFNFITSIPSSKLPIIKNRIIKVFVSHPDFPHLKSEIKMGFWKIDRASDISLVGNENCKAGDLFCMPVYDVEIILDGENRFRKY